MEQLLEITMSHFAYDLNINMYDIFSIFMFPQLVCILRKGIIVWNNKSSRPYEETGQSTLYGIKHNSRKFL
jgi:hypothetical protein